jgi:hypothetical protein
MEEVLNIINNNRNKEWIDYNADYFMEGLEFTEYEFIDE